MPEDACKCMGCKLWVVYPEKNAGFLIKITVSFSINYNCPQKKVIPSLGNCIRVWE